MSKEKKMKRYLIDGENVNDVWVNLLDRMKEDDKIVIFYTKNSPHIDYDKVMSIMSMKPKQVKWIRCYDGTNALDFQLCSVLGNMLAKKPKAEYFIVSNDTGYDAAVSFWKKNGYKVSRLKATDCAPTKEKKEEEEEEWTTSRRRRSPRRARQDRRNRSGRKQRITFRNGEPVAKDSRNEEGPVPAAAPAEKKEEILLTAEAVTASENGNAETELQEERRNSYRRRGSRRNRYGRRSENGANHEAAEDSLAVTGEAVSEESREIRETAAPKETREIIAAVEEASKQAPIQEKAEEKTAPAESEAEAAAAVDLDEADQAQETAGRRQNNRRSNNRRSNNRRGRRNETREGAETAEASAEAVTAENGISGETPVTAEVTADSVHADSPAEKADAQTEVKADVKPERKRPVIPGFVMITEEKEENWVRMRPEDLKETKPAAVEAETEAEAQAETAEVKAEETAEAPAKTTEAETAEEAPAETAEVKAEEAEEAPAETAEAKAEEAEKTPAETAEAKVEEVEEGPAETAEVKAEETQEVPAEPAEAEVPAEAAEEAPAEPAEAEVPAEAAEEGPAEPAEVEAPTEAAEGGPAETAAVEEEAAAVEVEETQEVPAETAEAAETVAVAEEVVTEEAPVETEAVVEEAVTVAAEENAANPEIPVDFTALLAEKIMEKAPCDEEACLRVVNCVERIVGSVAVTNRTLFHNALVAVLGAEGGDVIYSLLKGMPELQQLMKNRRQRKKNDRIRNYLELVLELSDIPDGDAEALNRFYHSMQKEELQKIYEECQKTFGQEQGNSYYQVIKKNFHILQKL